MKRSSYRDRDYVFGQTMVTLRTAIGLTQSGLADYLGVSRRAVGDWEAGSSYPKVEHLKKYIALGLQHEAFHIGQEAEEIRALWQASHQKVLLNEAWLSGLLASRETTLPAEELFRLPPATTPPHRATSRMDWGDALAIPTFYGREWELKLLTEWVVDERCRVVSVLGLGGIGKSAVSVSLMHQVAQHFDVVIWRSLRDVPTCEALLDDCLQVLAPQSLGTAPISLEQRLTLLIEYLRSQRALLVLDNLESLLEEGEGTGRMRNGYEGYERLLRRVAETQHQSCLLFTSREKPGDLVSLEGSRSPVRVLRLARLDPESCENLLAEKDVTGTAPERVRLVEAYAGNPLALKIVAQTIAELFDGEIAPFLEQGEVIFGGVRELLREQFARLSALEQCVMLWLAILREPAGLDELVAVQVVPVQRARLLEAVEALHRRSLIERGQRQGSFTLQSVVLEYVTARLIVDVSSEIHQGQLARLIEYGIELAQTREYVRQTQERLIVAPILNHLRSLYPQRAVMEEQLLTLLRQLASQPTNTQGYAPANIMSLLRLQRGHLRSLDLSGLALRGVYLQGVEMQDARLNEVVLQDSVFTETFDVTTAVAISDNGEYWAAASRRGEMRVWAPGGRKLHQAWRAHTDMAWTLQFSPDGRMLVSGSWDGKVKVWDAATGQLVWLGRHTSHVNTVAFAPDGQILATGGNDAVVRLWDWKNNSEMQLLPHPRPLAVVLWNPAGDLLATADLEGVIRLWAFNGNEPAICLDTLIGHTNWVDGLTFSPDGRTLASASWDGTVKLWDMQTRQLLTTLTGHRDRVLRLAWSPDGRTLASCSRDRTIWLWDAEYGSYRAVLHGHSAGVNGLAFTPDSHSLVSGSEDGTLRVWDVVSGECVRVIQGHAVSLYDLDWSPDGTHLVTSGTDYLVTVYNNVNDEAPPRLLRGHIGVVFGVGWSPDGRRLASSEWDNMIRVWDTASGATLQVLQHPDDPGNYFYGLAWSPNGERLACGTYRRGVQVFEMNAGALHWVGQDFTTWIRHVAWSPDGTQIAGGGDDGTVYVWDAATSEVTQRLTGHQSMVTRVTWCPNGRWLASSGSNRVGGELFVWDVERGEQVTALGEHLATVYAVAWGASENSLVSGDSEGTLRWWDITSGECLLVRQAHQGTIQALRRSPDGTRLASCGDDGAIMVWDSASGEHLQTLRRDRPYERLNISGIRGLSEVQKAALHALGAIEN